MGNNIKLKAISNLKVSSKVREFEIQYVLKKKYPNPNINPIKNDVLLLLEKIHKDRKNKG